MAKSSVSIRLYAAQQSKPLLSIIIPAYNEEKRLPIALDKIKTWMDSVNYEVEILVVENGSRDRTTEVAEAYMEHCPDLRVLHSDKGKGAAVREGMLNGRGEYLFICDTDISMPIAEVENFLPPKVTDYDVVIGSREAPGAVRYNEPFHRHLMGRVFNFLVKILAVPGFHDTQCGFKLFKREVALELFSSQTITGWTFDVEVLYLALKRGYRVVEVPIHWYYDADSRVNPLRDTWQMFWDVIRIRLNHYRGAYNSPRLTVRPAKESATSN